jgi:hypothetical protein
MVEMVYLSTYKHEKPKKKKIFWWIMWWNYIAWMLIYDEIKEILIMVSSLDSREALWVTSSIVRRACSAGGSSRCSTP